MFSFSSDQRCNKYTDCASCCNYRQNVFYYGTLVKGMYLPNEICLLNTLCFMLKGEVLLNSEEHPNLHLKEGMVVLEPIGARIELKALEHSECILYRFEIPLNVCNERYMKGNMHDSLPEKRIILPIVPPLALFLESVKMYINDNLLCAGFMQASQIQLAYILNCYYPIKDLALFYSPLYAYSRSFHYFVTQNYMKIKDVQEFAELGGYSLSTFRRLFKDTFGEPVYQWIVRKKARISFVILQPLIFLSPKFVTVMASNPSLIFPVFVKLILANPHVPFV